jgi:hypothetical protein
MNLRRTLLPSLALCSALTSFGKCYVWSSSLQVIREADSPVSLASTMFSGLLGNLGTTHLGISDQLRFDVGFECPTVVTVWKDGALFATSVEDYSFSMNFDADGQYALSTEVGSWTGCAFGVDHSTDPLSTNVLNVSAFLSGAMQGTTMRDNLRASGLLPLTEPYTAMGMPPTDPSGSLATQQVMANSDVNLAVVDWVLVELRSAADPTQVVYSKCGMLRRNGDLRAPNGPVFEVHVPPGEYYIALRHRNHLGVMTAAPVGLYGIARTVDLRSTSTATWGTDAQQSVDLYKALWPGNVSNTAGAQRIKYIGAGNDRDPVLQRIGGSTPNLTAPGYYTEDVNMNGVVKYVGANNDRDVILQTIGGTVPTAVRVEQLPY